jgi:hypothetical protein
MELQRSAYVVGPPKVSASRHTLSVLRTSREAEEMYLKDRRLRSYTDGSNRSAIKEAKDLELHFGSEPQHHCALNAPADIRVVLNYRLYKQHRQGI